MGCSCTYRLFFSLINSFIITSISNAAAFLFSYSLSPKLKYYCTVFSEAQARTNSCSKMIKYAVISKQSVLRKDSPSDFSKLARFSMFLFSLHALEKSHILILNLNHHLYFRLVTYFLCRYFYFR